MFPIKVLTFEFDANNRRGKIGITCDENEDGRKIALKFIRKIHPGIEIGSMDLKITEARLGKGFPGQFVWHMESFAKTWESKVILE